jgi:hypothetical protein
MCPTFTLLPVEQFSAEGLQTLSSSAEKLLVEPSEKLTSSTYNTYVQARSSSVKYVAPAQSVVELAADSESSSTSPLQYPALPCRCMTSTRNIVQGFCIAADAISATRACTRATDLFFLVQVQGCHCDRAARLARCSATESTNYTVAATRRPHEQQACCVQHLTTRHNPLTARPTGAQAAESKNDVHQPKPSPAYKAAATQHTSRPTLV